MALLSILRYPDPRLHKLLAGSAQVFRSYLEPRGVLSLFDGSVVEPQPVCAVAAIANPEGFFQSLEHQGFSLVERVSLPDHHEFSLDEVSGLLARYPNTLCVCTAKDAVKLRMFGDQVAKRFAVLHVVANVVPRDAFVTQVERLIQRAV
jgi:tetraacyldisaccharide-1-P 4'-kinase